MYAGDMRASRGKRQICELLRKQNGGHFCEKVALFSVDTTFEKKFFFKYFRFRYAHAVFTVVLPDDWRIFLVTCIMSLRRTVWPQFNFQVTFSHFFPTPPSNMASRRHFPEMARHRHFNRRRREHGDTLFCNKIFVASSRNSVIPLLLKKYQFRGEN